MSWDYARLVQKLQDINDAVIKAQDAAQNAGEVGTKNSVYKRLQTIRNQLDEMAQEMMEKGGKATSKI